jgi:hypothetical protein
MLNSKLQRQTILALVGLAFLCIVPVVAANPVRIAAMADSLSRCLFDLDLTVR